MQLLEASGLSDIAVQGWAALPLPENFDDQHRRWRDSLVRLAAETQSIENFTHGVAAKLINGYLKHLFVCGMGDQLNLWPDEQRSKMANIHPPIDRLLLTALANENVGGLGTFWRNKARQGWSKFSSDEYEEVLENIRRCTAGELWRIEQHWVGFR